MKRIWFLRMIALSTFVALSSATAALEPTTSKKGKDPNEKVCETQQVLGSRLASRRVCATRAEWAERRQRERDMVDRTQIQRCSLDPATGLCGSQ